MKEETIKSLRTLKHIFETNIQSSTSQFEELQWENVLEVLQHIEKVEDIKL